MPNTEIKIKQKLDKEISSFFENQPNARSRNLKRKLTYSEFLSDRMLIIRLIRSGIPYPLFSLIKHITPFTENDWASLLEISTKSLNRYKRSSKSFKPIQSEKILEMAEVTDLGMEVFGDMQKFKLWLNTPVFSLGNNKPFELLKDSYGKEMVIAELIRINHGILA